MQRNLLVVICRTSGKQVDIDSPIKELAATYGVTVKNIHIKIPPELSRKLAKENLDTYDAVAVYGGDGTVVAAIKYFQPLNKPLIIIPGGTANVVAKYLSMPSDPVECLRVYFENQFVTRRLDIAYINGMPLVLDMHVGLWTESLSSTPRKLKKRLGKAAYAWSTLLNSRNAKRQNYTFAVNDNPAVKVPGYTLLIANQGEYRILGLPVFPYNHAPGLVQMLVVKTVSPVKLIAWYFYKLTTGRNLNSVISVLRAKKIKILRAPRHILADDTERFLSTPLEIIGSDDAQRVLVPPLSNKPSINLFISQLNMWWLRSLQRLRVFTGHDPQLRYSHVAAGIYLGGKIGSRTFKLFKEWGVTGIVSMRMSKPPRSPKDIETLWLPTKDWTPPSLESFRKGVDFINKKLSDGGAVYIHCQLGEGRGPSMAAAYLISQGFTAEEAIEKLVKVRPVTRPNPSQLKQLAQWQDFLSRQNNKA